jgi:DNA-binding GntR family transcriptional regulator
MKSRSGCAMLVEGRIARRKARELLNIPLREAIKLLAAAALAGLLPNRCAVAVKQNETDVTHSCEVLAELEGLSGELAAHRISAAEVAQAAALHCEMLACLARQDLPGYDPLSAQIHTAINRAARNPVQARPRRSQPRRRPTHRDRH